MSKLFYSFIFLVVRLGFAQTGTYTITNLELNTKYPHFGVMQGANDRLIFTSYLLDKKGRPKRFLGEPILTVFEGDILQSTEIKYIKPIPIDPKQNIPRITSAVISLDKTLLFITTNYTFKNKPKGNFNMDNFHIKVGAYKVGLGWTNFKVLPFCKPKYSYAHPTLSKDGKTLYFTANIRGGKETTKGGSDIFKVTILDDGTYSEPKNMGTRVNSYSREMFPYISDDNTLYFASNRPGGFGEFDIYKSIMGDDGAFKKAKKLPKPINSNSDDFSLVISADNKSGYFSSKRDQGKGGDDIYSFIKEN